MIRVNGIRLALDDAAYAEGGALVSGGPLCAAAARALGVEPGQVAAARAVRCNVDARRKADVRFAVNADVVLGDAADERWAVERGAAAWSRPVDDVALPQVDADAPGFMRPVVVGTGPAGLFCALFLARCGARPVVVERGACVEERARAVERFFAGGPLDRCANIQFGEGGAGMFSDGKLTTGTKGRFAPHVLRWFADAGAPPEIAWDAAPHIGSDRLPAVVRAMRDEICDRGGQVRFRTQLVDVRLEGGHVAAAVLRDADGGREALPCRQLVVACGHSARDTFAMLLEAGLRLERKPFSMGVRIEHEQAAVNRMQWGAAAGHPALAGRAASYKAVAHLGDRSVYTFCMCPGGTVVAAASEEGGVVVNGMSPQARDGGNANAALLVNVEPDDFEGEGPLAGARMQQRVERAAFAAAQAAGGAAYTAPAQTVGGFLGGAAPADAVRPTYPRGTAACDLRAVLPGFVCDALARALPALDRKMPGFADPRAVMTAPETRSSSPVRIRRGADLQAVAEAAWRAAAEDARAELDGGSGLYPCGEGAGYAGGIASAAADGLLVGTAVAAALGGRMPAEGGVPEADPEAFARLVRAAVAGGVLVFPTDTVYGAGVAVRFGKIDELYALKQRAVDKPVAWLVDGPAALDAFGRDVPAYARRLARSRWPGALTLVVRAGDAVPRAFRSAQGTIGLRMPAHADALALVRAVGPVATTSANLSGAAPAAALRDVDPVILAGAAAVLPDRGAASGTASTVLDCTGPEPRVLRA